MMPQPWLDNLLPWMGQVLVLASVGASLPILFRVRHPRTQLAYCHTLLAVCLLLPLIEPWRHPTLISGPANDVANQASEAAPLAHSLQIHTGPALRERPSDAASSVPLATRLSLPARLRANSLFVWILAAGVVGRLLWLLAGLWRIRRYRIAATPLYPIPESVTAAAALTNADALVCISSEVPGPVMSGWFSPVVLLPESFLSLGEEAQCGIACHELLHVRRHDWLVTVLEEVAGALFWFNPAIWWLLAQARLAREQLVDAEVVRLTASREPYIDALLTIARARPSLDLAPAPLFFRRRHLTQRMHSLLKEFSMSRLRLFWSYVSIVAILTATAWFAFASFPLIGSPRAGLAASSPAPLVPARAAVAPMLSALAEADLAVAPVPPDPYELVNGGVRSLVMPADRTAAIYLLERAKQYSKLHMPDTPAYRMQVSFNASGSAADTGPGELTETRWPTQGWRWTARLGSFSIVRVGFRRQMFGDKHVTAIPMRIHMLRNAIFWAAQATPSNAQIRMAAVQANGSPATCILLSGMPPATQSQTRLWEEAEYCIDNASGALLVHSTAPGTFTVYGYTKNLQFHGRLMPDRITIYVAGATVVDAHLEIADAGPVDESLLKPTPEMLSNGEPVSLSGPTKFPLIASSPSPTNMIQPVIVLAEIDAEGNVPDLEVSSAANAALAPAALEFVKKRNFGASGSQRVAYINVKFVPLPQSN